MVPVHWHILSPGSLGIAKSFYSTKKVNIDSMVWKQSDTLRSQSKLKQSGIVPTHQILSHTRITRPSLQGSGHGEAAPEARCFFCGFMLAPGGLLLNYILLLTKSIILKMLETKQKNVSSGLSTNPRVKTGLSIG